MALAGDAAGTLPEHWVRCREVTHAVAVCYLNPAASGGCEASVGHCSSDGTCTVNVGTCEDGGSCTVNVGRCDDSALIGGF